MRIHVIVKPHARKNSVTSNDTLIHNLASYTVAVQALPIDGKANEAVIEQLAKYFHTKKRAISIISGDTAREKIIEIVDL